MDPISRHDHPPIHMPILWVYRNGNVLDFSSYIAPAGNTVSLDNGGRKAEVSYGG